MAKKTKAEQKRAIHVEIIRQMITLTTSSFGLVAALAWNNVIQDLVNNYIRKWLPQGSSLISLFIYAVIITILAVFITLQLSRLLEKLDEK